MEEYLSDTKAALPAYYSNPRPELVQLVDPMGWRVLEVGCAAGAMGAALLEKGAAEVVGLDLFEEALVHARMRLSAVHRVDLNALPELPYPDGHFDLITFADVLEHLVEPVAVLRHLRRWLRDDGRILISIPNVRHESVVLPLLVEGKWEYADWGILDRTHLRFFTRGGLLQLLEGSGFRLLGKLSGVQTGVPSYAKKAAELVGALGGDVGSFMEECDVIQFVALATPMDHRFGAVAASSAATTPSAATVGDPWAGSKKTRVLFVPELDGTEDCWAKALPAIARGIEGNLHITLGIALPNEFLADPPSPVRAIAGTGADLLLTGVPHTLPGWEALLRGTSLLVLTSDQPELTELARRCGAQVQDVRSDSEIGIVTHGASPVPRVHA
jgi:SAM-dependent methyltransferase